MRRLASGELEPRNALRSFRATRFSSSQAVLANRVREVLSDTLR
jgi:hypothetical protein